MAGQGWTSRFVALGIAAALGASLHPGDAEAARSGHHALSHAAAHHGAGRAFASRGYGHGYAARGHRHHWASHQAVASYATDEAAGAPEDVADAYAAPRYVHGISCVPFARENSGIEVAGNAANWWANAAGVYARGNRPELGSVLNFRATGRMRLGHVAVVTNVLGPRVVEVDHANWSSHGAVSRGVRVEDVSPGNDWTAVRVALGAAPDGFGSVYPTYGFIYDRPEGSGVMLASAPHGARLTDALAPSAAAAEVDEVAELPDTAAPHLRHGARHARFTAGEARRHHRRHHRYG
jgi:hypothetical protein